MAMREVPEDSRMQCPTNSQRSTRRLLSCCVSLATLVSACCVVQDVQAFSAVPVQTSRRTFSHREQVSWGTTFRGKADTSPPQVTGNTDVRSRSTVLYSATAFPRRTVNPPMPGGGSVSSSLITSLAEYAIKMRLPVQQSVSCEISRDPNVDLFRGMVEVGPVALKGRGWQSELGLTCRAIEANVQTCKLDLGRVIRDRKLRLSIPAKGDAMVAVNSVDFGNFITHPLLQSPTVLVEKDGTKQEVDFSMRKENVKINDLTGEIVFYGDAIGMQWQCTLTRSRNGKGAQIQAVPVDGTESQGSDFTGEVSRSLTHFFNTFVLNLNGVHLSFRDMMIVNRERGSSDKAVADKSLALLALNMEVHKFPSRKASF